ncbi:hypothetical protein AB6C70_05550 [Vibrio splendidus]
MQNYVIIYKLLVTLVFFTYLDFIPYSWALKDIGVILFIAYFFLTFDFKSIRLPSLSLAYLYISMLLVVLANVFLYGLNPIIMISIRFLFIYPLLIIVGYNLSGYFSEKTLFNPIAFYSLIVIFVALLEIFIPDAVHAIFSSETKMKALYRTGAGYGLGSIFSDRVALGLCLVLAQVFSRLYLSENKMIVASLFIFMLVSLTLNKTAMVCSSVILLKDVLKPVFLSRSSALKKVSSIYLLVCVFLLSLVFFNESYIALFTSIADANFFTLSGRTTIWQSLDISIQPNFFAVGASSFSENKMVLDNAFIRFVITYGLLIIPALLSVLIVCLVSYRGSNEILNLLVLILVFLAMTIDLFAQAFFITPIWFVLGCYINSDFRNRSRL